MRRFAFMLSLMLPLSASATTSTDQPVVIALHGLGLGGWAMSRVAGTLEQEGYRVINLSYDSTKVPLEELVATWLPAQLSEHEVGLTESSPPLYFVTHSMGGILLRGWLAQQAHPPPNLHRVVMFAPPNQGSSLVDRVGSWKLFKIMTGVNGGRLSTQPDSYPNQLGPWPAGPELGILAGNKPLNPFFAHWTGEANDGKVRVEETKLEGMTDHLIMPHSHTWIQYRKAPISQVAHFFREGRFNRPPQRDEAATAESRSPPE